MHSEVKNTETLTHFFYLLNNICEKVEIKLYNVFTNSELNFQLKKYFDEFDIKKKYFVY